MDNALLSSQTYMSSWRATCASLAASLQGLSGEPTPYRGQLLILRFTAKPQFTPHCQRYIACHVHTGLSNARWAQQGIRKYLKLGRCCANLPTSASILPGVHVCLRTKIAHGHWLGMQPFVPTRFFLPVVPSMDGTVAWADKYCYHTNQDRPKYL